MASDHLRRRQNNTTDREIHLEKDRVPKMTTHLESLAAKASDQSDNLTGGSQTLDESTNERHRNSVADVFGADQKAKEHHGLEPSAAPRVGGTATSVSATIVAKTDDKSQKNIKGQEINAEDKAKRASKVGRNRLQGESRVRPFAVGKFEMSGEEDRGGSVESQAKESSREVAGRKESSEEEKDHKGGKSVPREEGGQNQDQLSLDEISKLRALAQQNSTDTIRSAEEQYNAAKESSSGQGLRPVAEYAKEKGAQAREAALQTTEYATEKGAQAKDTIVGAAKKTSQYISEKGTETKDTATEKVQQRYAATKDTLVGAGKTAMDYTAPVVEQAKDYTVDVSKNLASYAGEKAAATKDVTMELGKGAAQYAGKVAADVKDKAVVAGWSATHYTTEKAVEGTKVAAKVAEYAGHKAVEIAAKPLEVTKQAAATAGESMKEYTARKKEEAERELQAKRAAENQETEKSPQNVESKEKQQSKQGDQEQSRQNVESKEKQQSENGEQEQSRHVRSKGKQQSEKIEQESLGGQAQNKQIQGGQAANKQMEGAARTVDRTTEKKSLKPPAEQEGTQTGVLGAIGETIAEIAQTTRELVIGPDEPKFESGGYGEYEEHGESKNG